MSSRKRTIGEERIRPSQGGSLTGASLQACEAISAPMLSPNQTIFASGCCSCTSWVKANKIAIPVLRIADVAAALVNRVAALAADLVGVEAGLRLVPEQVVAEVGVVDRRAAEPVDADDDDIRLGFFGNPLPVAERVGLGAVAPFGD